MIAPREHWATSADGVRVHALEWSGGVTDSAALVFVPGGTGNAWSAEAIGNAMLEGRLGSPRRVLGVSRRGMGLSDAPARNYAPRHFANDIEALIDAAGISRYVLFGHSMGVPISIEYALRQPRGLVGVIVGDAPAQYIDFAESGPSTRCSRDRFSSTRGTTRSRRSVSAIDRASTESGIATCQSATARSSC